MKTMSVPDRKEVTFTVPCLGLNITVETEEQWGRAFNRIEPKAVNHLTNSPKILFLFRKDLEVLVFPMHPKELNESGMDFLTPTMSLDAGTVCTSCR